MINNILPKELIPNQNMMNSFIYFILNENKEYSSEEVDRDIRKAVIVTASERLETGEYGEVYGFWGTKADIRVELPNDNIISLDDFCKQSKTQYDLDVKNGVEIEDLTHPDCSHT